MDDMLIEKTKKTALICVASYFTFAIIMYFLAIFGSKTNQKASLYYIICASVFAILVVAYFYFAVQKAKKGKMSLLLKFVDISNKYGYLMSQLVIRDFKSKYKRSVLGVLWSFLNPLLMMTVQYLIFSTIFGGRINMYTNDSYAVYLLIGLVFFNFFSESCNMGLSSITGNAPLITKVYVPKYIYPVSRVISSMINLGFSLVPLLLIMVITGVWPTVYALLIFFDIALFVLFCLGMAMLLGAIMVFFRDIQFLWSILLTVWMYATPIFYSLDMFDTSGTKGKLLTLVLKCNPLYHYISFARDTILNGCSPTLLSYLYCIVCTAIMLTVGLITFKKTQDKFVLYI